MKTINETFTDEEYVKIIKIKNILNMTWHDFILQIVDLAEQFVEAKKNDK